MSGKWIKIAAPATISNIGPGFDIFGMALKEPFDIIEGRVTDGKDIIISEITGPGAETIPTDPEKNSVGIAASAVKRRCNSNAGMELRIKKGIRPCSGIGSSGASAAGGAYIANILCNGELTESEQILCATEAEKVTSGGSHADNVAPCIMGGFTIVRSYDPFEVIRIEPPKDLGVVVAMPDVMVSTKDARAVLPKEVSVKDLIFHAGNSSCLAHAMQTGNTELIGRSVQDAVFEPARTHLVPHLKEAEATALSSGAIASFLGGSGPCVISFFRMSENNGNEIANRIKEMYASKKMRCDTWVTGWGQGCRRL